MGCWAGPFQPKWGDQLWPPVTLSSACWTGSGFCALCSTPSPWPWATGPSGSPEITGKQVLGLAKCWVLRPKRQCSWLGPGHGAESCPLLLSSTAARFALNFLGFLPTVSILISKDMSSYQGTGAGSRRESLSGSASSRGDFLPRCLR